ncbi:MAG: glutamate ligase domain-containing protein, partial [Gemmatimonadota bacterium]
GAEWGVDPDEAVAALATIEAPSMRGETYRYGDLVVVADCYNANPASLAASLDTLVAMPRRGGRVAVVGSMLELGARSEALHREAAARVAGADVDLVVAVGLFEPAFEPLREAMGDRLITVPDTAAAVEPLLHRLRGDEVVLLKGSRGVALEELMPRLEERFGEPGEVG